MLNALTNVCFWGAKRTETNRCFYKSRFMSTRPRAHIFKSRLRKESNGVTVNLNPSTYLLVSILFVPFLFGGFLGCLGSGPAASGLMRPP